MVYQFSLPLILLFHSLPFPLRSFPIFRGNTKLFCFKRETKIRRLLLFCSRFLKCSWTTFVFSAPQKPINSFCAVFRNAVFIYLKKKKFTPYLKALSKLWLKGEFWRIWVWGAQILSSSIWVPVLCNVSCALVQIKLGSESLCSCDLRTAWQGEA